MKQSLLAAAILLSATAFSQQVSNQLQFQKGQKMDVVTQVASVISMDMMGQSMETKINATISRVFDVADVSATGAKIEHKVKRLQMAFEAPMAGSQTFDSEKESDMKGEGGKMAEKALKNKYTMTVDANGKVTAVQADNNNPNKATAGADNDMMSGAVSQMTEGMTLPQPGEMSEFKILPDHAINKGETWADSSLAGKAVYTVSDITATEILIAYTEEGTTNRKQEANGMEISISTKDKTNGKIILDKATRLLKSRTAETASEGTMEMMGQSLPMTTKVTKTVTVKPS